MTVVDEATTTTRGPRQVVYGLEHDEVDAEAFKRHSAGKGQPSPFDKIIVALDNPQHWNKWKWIAKYGNRDTANQTASRLRKQYPGVRFQRGDHPDPVHPHGVAAFYDPEAVAEAGQED